MAHPFVRSLTTYLATMNRPRQSPLDRVLWTLASLKGVADRRELRIRSRMALAELNAVLGILEKENKIIIVPKRTGRQGKGQTVVCSRR